MKFFKEGEYYYLEFTSGRKPSAYGILGLDLLDGNVGFSESYYAIDEDADCNDLPFTPDERRELADFMIERWRKFAEGE